jgi:hypothetical protein
MIPMRIEGETRRLAENQDEYISLSVRDQYMNEIGNVMTTLWEPTQTDVENLKKGGAVLLHIVGTVFQPVIITTQPAPDMDENR